MSSFALARLGTSGTTAGTKAQIGADITFPAGGPWIVNSIWGVNVLDTAVADESSHGIIQIDALSGDISPDPAPGKYPASGISSMASANTNTPIVAINRYAVNWTASGKAVIALSFINDAALTNAGHSGGGVIFGDAIPTPTPLVFCDAVGATVSLSTETSLGAITLAEKATRIVGILATMHKDAAFSTNEGAVGLIRLDSNDIQLAPSQFPMDVAISAGDGTLAGGQSQPHSPFIPVDIPVVGGAIVNCFATISEAITSGVEVQVFLAYE